MKDGVVQALYPMLDDHDNRIVSVHRAVFTVGARSWPVAVSPRDGMERWLSSDVPVHSLCQVVVRDGQETITRHDHLTLTGLELEGL